MFDMFRAAHVDNLARATVLILRQDALGFREAETRAAEVAVVDEDCGQVIFFPPLLRKRSGWLLKYNSGYLPPSLSLSFALSVFLFLPLLRKDHFPTL